VTEYLPLPDPGDLNLQRYVSHLAHLTLREFGYWNDDHNFALYRLYDIAGGLIYVGITSKSVRSRLSVHRRRDWWSRVVRIEVVYGYTRAEAESCELAAIQGEQPLCNISGVNYAWPRRGGLAGGWAYH